MSDARPFFLVLARDASLIPEKIRELQSLHVPYVIVCGEMTDIPNVIFREPNGKYDAINFGVRSIPTSTSIVALNDVDTKIHNFESMLKFFKEKRNALLFARPYVVAGPQVLFYKIMNALRRVIPIASSGELMLIERRALDRVLPIRPCKAEDSYILFRILELGYHAALFDDCLVETARTKSAKGEEEYKKINVTGIYQALSQARAPVSVRLFYFLLPIIAPLLSVLGENGYHWSRGILLGFLQYLRGDASGSWKTTYLDI